MLKGLKNLVTGLIAGAAIGVLFAPKKGSEVRDSIKKDIKDGGIGLDPIKDTAVSMGKDISKESKKAYDKLNTNPEVKKGISKVKEVFNKAKETVEEKIDEMKKKND